jgi:3-hydroxyisobutyrate dehydrogenase-like beta-hydroxyacid dehydrogenase
LSVIGKVFWVGEEPGMGQTMKVCNNLMSATAVAITSEALVVGTKAGLDPAIMLDVINAGSGRNTASADKFPRCVLPRKFDFGFASELLYKDVRLCLEEAERLGVPMIVGNAVRQLLAVTKATQGEGSDITETVKPLEAWAGVEVKPKASRS